MSAKKAAKKPNPLQLDDEQRLVIEEMMEHLAIRIRNRRLTAASPDLLRIIKIEGRV